MLNRALKDYLDKAISSIRQKREKVEYIEKKTHDRQIAELNKQIDLLREKFRQFHSAMIYLDLLKVREIDDPAAKLNPVEVINKGEKETMMVFGGMLNQISMPPKEFFNSLMNSNVNLIFVKDFLQCWYQKGLIGKSTDIPTTTAFLQSILPKETEKLICLGTSAGGYAAIRFGADLGADKIIAFSPQTRISQKVFNKFKSMDSRIGEINLNSPDLDLKVFLSKRGYKNIELYYGIKNDRDVSEAMHIKDFILPRPLDTSTHNVAFYLKKRGELNGILDRCFAGR